ncbi:MAG: DnaJ C-terminal domain-containing protein [Elusimicrobiaceae bacterium]
MTTGYKDYYQILGVTRQSTADEIKNSYRKLARQYHPDMHKDEKKAEMSEKFKDLNEAYEVLSDPKKKQMYDQVGPDWDRQNAGSARPSGFGGENGGPRVYSYNPFQGAEYSHDENYSGFSDFFNSIFGGAGGAQENPFRFEQPAGSSDVEAELPLSLEEAFYGGTKRISVPIVEIVNGKRRKVYKDISTNLPPGIADGAKIRLKGQRSISNGRKGDLLIRIRIQPDPRFKIIGNDMEVNLNVYPWIAALGGEIAVPSLDGSVRVKVPPGTKSGQKMKIAGHGYGTPDGPRGNLYAVLNINNPPTLSVDQRELYKKLSDIS